MIIVRVEHMRAVGIKYCSRGARAFAMRYGLDWHKFIHEGLPEQVLLDTNDAMAIAVVNEARRQWAEKATTPQ